MIRGWRQYCLALTLLWVLTIPALGVSAASPSTLQIEPARLEVTARPGQKLAGKFTLVNTSNAAVAVRFTSTDRRVHPGGRVEMMRGTMLPNSAAPWVVLSPFDHPLEPGDRREFDWGLSLPGDGIGPGDYTAMLFAEVVPKGPPALSAPDRVGALVVVNVPGQAPGGGRIILFRSPPDTVTFPPRGLPKIPSVEMTLPGWLRRPEPLKASFSFVNEGGARVRATGSLEIVSNGRTLVTVPAGDAQELFPGDAADFRATWPAPPLFGTFEIVARVDLGTPRPAEDRFVVHVMPWPWALTALVPLSIGVGLVVWRRRSGSGGEYEDVGYLDDPDVSWRMPDPTGRESPKGPPRPMRPPASGSAPPPVRRLPRTTARTLSDPPLARSSPAPRVARGTDEAPAGPGFQSPGPIESTTTVESTAGPIRPAADPGPPPGPLAEPPLVVPTAAGPVPLGGLLAAGIAAVQRGEFTEACGHFVAAVERDERCVEAWLLRAGTAATTEESERCLCRALALDPGNAWAIEGLRLLTEWTLRQLPMLEGANPQEGLYGSGVNRWRTGPEARAHEEVPFATGETSDPFMDPSCERVAGRGGATKVSPSSDEVARGPSR